MSRLTYESLSKAEKRQITDERIAMLDEPEWDEGYGQPLRYPDEDFVYSNLNSHWSSHAQQSMESQPIKKRKLNLMDNKYDDDDEYHSLFSPPPSPSDIFSQNSDFSCMVSSLDSQDHYFHRDQLLHPVDKDDSNDEFSNDNPFLKIDKQHRENNKENQPEIQTVKKGEENSKYDVKQQFELDEEYGHIVPEHYIYCRHIDYQIFKAPRQSIHNPSLKKRRLVATQHNTRMIKTPLEHIENTN